MNSQSAFKMYWGIKLHFTEINYNILKYGTNTKSTQNKFDTLSPEQRFRFEWLGTKYPGTQDLVYACLGCELDGVSAQFGQKEEIIQSYIKFKGRREAMTYTLKSDVSNHELEDFAPLDKLIFKYFVGKYSPEYLLLLTHETDKLLELYNSPNLSWGKEKILKLIKYKDFFPTKKYLNLLNNNENVVN